MLAYYRNASKKIPRPLVRYMAEVVNPVFESSVPFPSDNNHKRRRQRKRKPSPEPLKINKLPVREDHGLYAFFRRKPEEDLMGEDRYEVFETPEEARLLTGRPWEASELRNKSFKDLHILWYVALREKNLLATQKEETRRMGVVNTAVQVSPDKVRHVLKTMAKVKYVLNERRLAFEGAMKLAKKQSEVAKKKGLDVEYDEEDEQILEFQLSKQRKMASEASEP